MATPQHDLWPAALGNGANTMTNTPVGLLNEQASFLATKTNNVVKAEVLTQPLELKASASMLPKGYPQQGFRHKFYLLAPALGNFRYLLFEIGQPIEMYPLVIIAAPTEDEIGISNQDEFMEALRKIFAHQKTQNVIEAMRAQSADVASQFGAGLKAA